MTRYLIVSLFFLLTSASNAQVTSGVFGNEKTLDGVEMPNIGHTTDKWIKLAELTLNGNWHPAGITVDFFGRNSNHGDSRQQLSVQFRNDGGTKIESSYDIALVTFYGLQKTIKDVKVIHTSGTGVIDNKLSVWVQMGISWLDYVPIEVRTYGNVTFETTNQPCFTSIPEHGTVFDLKTSYGMYGDQFAVNGNIRAKEVKVELENWPDYVFERDYALPSLSEVKNFIEQHGHLPDIPNAKEIQQQGVSLGELNAKLLQKIEELTLYALGQDDLLKKQQTLIDTLNARVSQMESQINNHETPNP